MAFFLIFYSHENQFYYLTLRSLLTFWNRMQEGGRKSFRREELESQYYLNKKSGFLVPFLDGIQIDLDERGIEKRGTHRNLFYFRCGFGI